jgi:hypothetical protein
MEPRILPAHSTFSWTLQEYISHIESVANITGSYLGRKYILEYKKRGWRILEIEDDSFKVRYGSLEEAIDAFIRLESLPEVGEVK